MKIVEKITMGAMALRAIASINKIIASEDEKLPPDFRDDCGFLLIGEEDLSYVIPEINLNFFSSSDSILHNPLDPLASTRHG
jgi:hypothetical protein